MRRVGPCERWDWHYGKTKSFTDYSAPTSYGSKPAVLRTRTMASIVGPGRVLVFAADATGELTAKAEVFADGLERPGNERIVSSGVSSIRLIQCGSLPLDKALAACSKLALPKAAARAGSADRVDDGPSRGTRHW